MDHFNYRRGHHHCLGCTLSGNPTNRIEKKARFLAFLFFCLLLGGLAHSQSQKGIWLDVPYEKQPEEGCGAASISMVLQYWNIHSGKIDVNNWNVEAIQKELYSPKSHGIFASDVEKYFKKLDFRTFAFEGKWEDLREHLAKGRPIIVGLQPNGKKAPLHFVVVTGIDWEKPAVFVNDPARGKLLRIERAEFEKTWQPVRNWMLLAVPQQAS